MVGGPEGGEKGKEKVKNKKKFFWLPRGAV